MKKAVVLVEVVAGVLIQREKKYLLVQEKKQEAYGLWNLPAGRVDVGESIEEAAVREAKEETGYDVELMKKIAVLHESIDKRVKHVFEARIVGGEFCYPKEEILDAQWFTHGEIEGKKDQLRNPWVLEAINILENLFFKIGH